MPRVPRPSTLRAVSCWAAALAWALALTATGDLQKASVRWRAKAVPQALTGPAPCACSPGTEAPGETR
jgi:hypothetical protein